MRTPVAISLVIMSLLVIGAIGYWWNISSRPNPKPPFAEPQIQEQAKVKRPPLLLTTFPKIKLWWEEQGPKAGQNWFASTETQSSNIHPTDYLGAESCKNCHPANFESWSNHPHKWMNALANDESVRGDFSGRESISYMGGKGTFEKVQGKYLMKLERPPVRRVYEIHQTIGSRFYQYYVGTLKEGPEPKDHHFYQKDHVLPFGYWLERKEWVPVVHIGPEQPDKERADPFQPPEKGRHYAEYASSCNHCHTTFSMGDMLVRRPQQTAEHAPFSMNWSVKSYLDQARPEESREMERLLEKSAQPGLTTASWEAPKYASSLGISCEACHLGSKEHVESRGKTPPAFIPSSPFLNFESHSKPNKGRTHDNINWACGRCHTGNRPSYAAGMSTWNSVEFADAMKGSCYSQLKCTDCHDPHKPTGPKWVSTPKKDDAVCLKCHEAFREPEKRSAHTHHPAGTEGDRCLNCHMPKINEGLNEVVRTHMIYSPTRKEMIHENQPNACNLCHTEKPIDWTLDKLKSWYGKTYEDWMIGLKYPNRNGPTALGWLASENPAVRLVAADALLKAKSANPTPEILSALDDPYLINRQFAGKHIEDLWKIRLSDFGYHFYQSREERKAPLEKVKAKLQMVAPKPPKEKGE